MMLDFAKFGLQILACLQRGSDVGGEQSFVGDHTTFDGWCSHCPVQGHNIGKHGLPNPGLQLFFNQIDQLLIHI